MISGVGLKVTAEWKQSSSVKGPRWEDKHTTKNTFTLTAMQCIRFQLVFYATLLQIHRFLLFKLLQQQTLKVKRILKDNSNAAQQENKGLDAKPSFYQKNSICLEQRQETALDYKQKNGNIDVVKSIYT